MTYWIRAYNHTTFRVADFIRDHGYIYWDQRQHFHVGDVVMLYLTAPDSRITHIMEVTQAELEASTIADEEAYFISQEAFEQHRTQPEKYPYVRLDLVMEVTSPALCLANLREHGLSGAPRSPRRLWPETVDWIMNNLR